MLTRENEIINAFEAHHKATGLAYPTIGSRAHREQKMYDRLTKGGSCRPDTYKEVMDWFKQNTPIANENKKSINKN